MERIDKEKDRGECRINTRDEQNHFNQFFMVSHSSSMVNRIEFG